ncbi:MAG: preprotein translocase subunit SecY [Candidatus Uhrbacteria bacterium]|nr:preprotein translocase subunit SecY [Patescibacteria group bacterium]MBU1907482.1 preprotein translocase subunit SecY [Patescibacteria group bacterium]
MLTLGKIWKIKEVRNSVLFVVGILILFRFAAHIPIPGVDPSVLEGLFEGNQFFGLLNIFSGGTLDNFSVIALGVAPYITASIIFQLLAMTTPKLEEMQKEEAGRAKINQWTRMATVPLAVLQGYGLLALLKQQMGGQLLFEGFDLVAALTIMTAGTIFLMWLGELITEKNIGNGISIMIFAGIIAGLPGFFQQTFVTFDRSELFTLALFAALTIVTIIGVVFMNEGTRNIPIQYARRMRGSSMLSGVASHLPLKVNQAGVIPIIFAISIVLFPTMVAQFLMNAQSEFLQNAAVWINQMFANQLIYGIIYFLLVFGFTYFYTSVIFHPDRVADNLQKSGGFVPGIRPGPPTAKYVGWVSNRILLAGAVFLSVIAVMPIAVQHFTGASNMVIGGTSILIVVSVIIDVIKQLEGQIAMREYEY